MKAAWNEGHQSWYISGYHMICRYSPNREKDNLWLHAEQEHGAESACKVFQECLTKIGIEGRITDCNKDIYWYATFKEEKGAGISFVTVADVTSLWREYAVKHGYNADAEVYFEDYVQCWTAAGIKLGHTLDEAYALLKSEVGGKDSVKYHLFVFHKGTDAMTLPFAGKIYKGMFDTLQSAMAYHFNDDDIVGDMRDARAYVYEQDTNGEMQLVVFAYCSAHAPFGSWYKANDRAVSE